MFRLLILNLKLSFSLLLPMSTSGPGFILYPFEWVQSPVFLSSVHLNDTSSLELTFSCSKKTEPGYIVSIQVFSQQAEVALLVPYNEFETIKAKVNRIVNANTVGVYHVAVEIRTGNFGQIIAANKFYCSVNLIGPRNSYKDLEVSLPVLRLGEYADFSIKADVKVQARPQDYFIVHLDPNLALSSFSKLLLASPDSSLFGSPLIDYKNNSISYFLKANRTSQMFSLSISSILVSLDYFSSVFFSLEIFSSGIPTVLEWFYAKADLNFAGNIVVRTWAPANPSFSASDIIPGLVLYMKLSFLCDNNLQSGTKISLLFSNINNAAFLSNTDYYLDLINLDKIENAFIDSTFPLSCKVDSSVAVSCFLASSLPKQTLVSVFLLSQFSSTPAPAQISQINAIDPKGNIISSLKSTITIPFLSESQLLSEPSVYPSDSLNGYSPVSNNGPQKTGVFIKMKLPQNTLDSDQIIISPFFVDSYSVLPNSITLSSPLKGILFSSPDLQSSTVLAENPVIKNGNLIISMQSVGYAKDQYVNIFISSESGNINLPAFASYNATRYEIYIRYSSSTQYLFAKPFIVQPSSLSELSVSQRFTRSGVPVNLPVKAFKLSFHNSFESQLGLNQKLFINFWITSSFPDTPEDLGSGLAPGDEYPLIDLLPNQKAILLKQRSSNLAAGIRVYISPFISMSATTITFPVFNIGNQYEYSVVIEQMVEDSNGFYYLVTNSTSFYRPYSATCSNDKNSYSFEAGQNIDYLQIDLQQSSFVLDQVVQIVFPKGFSFSPDFGISVNQGAMITPLKITTVNNINYKFPVVSLTIPAPVNSEVFLELHNLVSGSFLGSQFYIYTINGDDWGSNTFKSMICTPVSVTKKYYMTIYNLTPKHSKSGGADFTSMTLTAQIFLPFQVEFSNSSFINAKINSAFGGINSCKVYTYDQNFSTVINQTNCIVNLPENTVLVIYFIEIEAFPPVFYQLKSVSPFESITIIQKSDILYQVDTQDPKSLISFYPTIGQIPSNITFVSVFPNYPSPNASDFFISFVPVFDIPKNSTVRITGDPFNDDQNLFKNLWITSGFSSCNISNGDIYLNISSFIKGGTVVSVYKRKAINVGSAGTSKYFLITVSYYGITLIEDMVSKAQSVQKVIYTSSPQNLTSFYVYKDKQSQNDLAFYKFVLEANSTLTEGMSVVFSFSEDFYVYLGSVTEKYRMNPGGLYLTTLNSDSECYVLPWKIVCKLIQVLTVDNKITIELPLYNPSSATSQNISVNVVSTNDTIIYKSSYIDKLFNNFTETSLNFTLSDISDNKSALISLEFSVMLNQNISVYDTLNFEFPFGFDISVNNPYISCSVNTSVSLPYECSSFLNTIEVKFLNSSDQNTFSVTFEDLVKPSKGFIRSGSNFLWTNQVNCFYYSFNSSSVSQRMSSILNSVYLPFTEPSYYKVLVKCNNNENLILLSPELYTACYFTVNTTQLYADSIEIIPVSAFIFDSGSYILTREFFTVPFKIGIPYYFSQGLYYINWYTRESSISNKTLYGPMDLTPVQVFLEKPAEISVFYTQGVIKKQSSFPIQLSINSYYPYDPLYILISLAPKDSRYSLDNDKLIFTQSHNYGYFSINFNEDKNELYNNTLLTLSFSLAGRYVSSFNIPDFIDFLYFPSDYYNLSASLVFKYNEDVKYNQFFLELNQEALVSWAFGPSEAFLNDNFYSYSYILNKTYPLSGLPTSTQSKFENQLDAYIDYLQSIQDSDWINLQLTKRQYISSYIFYNQVYLKPGTSLLVDPFFAIPTLEYTLITWIKDSSGNLTSILWVNETGPFLNHCSVQLNLTANISDYSIFSQSLKVPKEKLSNISTSHSGSTFSYSFLVYSEYLSKVPPCTLLSSFDLQYIQSVNRSLNEVNLSFSEVPNLSFGRPEFLNFTYDVKNNFAVLNASTNIPATICCIAEYEPNKTMILDIFDIQFGQDRSRNPASYINCSEYPAGNLSISIPLSRLKTTGTYTLTCAMCNKYPLNPICTEPDSYISVEVGISTLPSNSFSAFFIPLTFLLIS